jgi:leucyl/phenylalanyl-tRNA--protein transferase
MAGGFRLLDTQFVTDHLRTFGAIEVPRRQYHKLLEAALAGEGDFAALDTKHPVTGAQALAHLPSNRSLRA